ncbi:MAG: tRNA (adenosine(37)-N6)-threonylcarbamoyltransferase complex dimerization subunit type 1 TsaB [Clostridia bacterium]|nr:tRNA (adenosine(37)-N6)-threonylcarbamoyltransferase complex dimerization subunit type 1 TsaB [Clostridia bacterium]
MLVFGIDTCCMAATAALVDERIMVAQTVINQNKTHSQIMMPQIENMFRGAEVEPKSVDAFAAAVGPGSFTGVRIGVATAKALAQAAGKPCVAVSTLEALAHASGFFDGIIAPILDARRDQVYNALFRGGKGLERLCDDRALALEELLTELKSRDEKVLFMGDATLVFREKIQEALGDKGYFAPRVTNLNLAGSVAEIGLEKLKCGQTVSCGELVPQYVRLSQAEREKLEKEGLIKQQCY